MEWLHVAWRWHSSSTIAPSSGQSLQGCTIFFATSFSGYSWCSASTGSCWIQGTGILLCRMLGHGGMNSSQTWWQAQHSSHLNLVSVLSIACQPVVDLETYMSSLEKKFQTVSDMVGKLSGYNDQNAERYFGCMQLVCRSNPPCPI